MYWVEGVNEKKNLFGLRFFSLEWIDCRMRNKYIFILCNMKKILMIIKIVYVVFNYNVKVKYFKMFWWIINCVYVLNK